MYLHTEHSKLLLNVHKVLSPSTFKTIIDTVRGNIIDMFMGLNEKVFGGEIDVKSESTQRHTYQMITNNITTGIYQSGNGIIDVSQSTIIGNLRETNEGLSAIAEEIADIRNELEKPKPRNKFLKTCFKALSWGGTATVQAAIDNLIGKAIDLL